MLNIKREKIFREIKSKVVPIIPLLFSIVIFIFIWLEIKAGQYYSFHSYIFDLGVNYNLMWRAIHGTGPVGWLTSFEPFKTIFYILAPILLLYDSPLTLLYLQTIAIGVGAFAIYVISMRLIGDTVISNIFSIIYLFYFPLGGALWYDFHYQVFFVPFYLFSISCFLKSRYTLYIILSILTSITSMFSPVLVFFSSLFLFFNDFEAGSILTFIRFKTSMTHKSTSILPLLIVATFSTILVVSSLIYVHISGGSFVEALTVSSGPTSSNIFLSVVQASINSLGSKVILIMILFTSLFFLPFLKLRTSLLFGPYILFAIPSLLHLEPYGTQYMSLFSPGYILAAIFSAKSILNGEGRKHKSILHRSREISNNKKPPNGRNRLISLLLIILIFNILIFLPFSPLNQYAKDSQFTAYAYYNTSHNTNVNTYDIELMNMINLVPKGGNALIQGNLPQLAGRPFFATPGFYQKSDNFSLLINDPQNYYFFYVDAYGAYPGKTMYQLSNEILRMGDFGTIAEVQGALALQKGYSGGVKYFIPQNSTLLFNYTFPNDSTLLVGNDFFLAPGLFQFNLNSSMPFLATHLNISMTLIDLNSKNVLYHRTLYLSTAVNNASKFGFEFNNTQYVQKCQLEVSIDNTVREGLFQGRFHQIAPYIT